MHWQTVLLGLFCIAAVACNESSARFVFEAAIVDGQNGNPVAGTDATLLRVGIQEGDLPAQEYEFAITDGDFDAFLEFQAFSFPTRVRIRMEGATTELLTAPPLFVPALSSGVLRVVASAPSSCERVTFDVLEAPRAFFGMAQSGTFSLIAGGATPADEQLEFFDALEWESRLFAEDFSVSDLGATRATSIDGAEILVLPTNTSAFIFNMVDTTNRITPVVLPEGMGPSSALVTVPGVGAMVIGGELAGEAISSVSLVGPGGDITPGQLSKPRSGSAATALGGEVLVVGGDPEGTAEVLTLVDDEVVAQALDGVTDGVRESALLVGDGESRALWMGGTDAADGIRQDTVRFDGCPDNCVSSAGPTWSTARLGSLQPAMSALVIGGVDSTLVDEVRWDGANVEIEPLLQLEVPRAGAGGIVLESGAFVVAGGDDGVSIRDDFEFCVPAALEPL